MKKFFTFVLIFSLALSIFLSPVTTYASSFVPTVEEAFTVFVDGAETTWTSTQLLEWIKGVQDGVWNSSVAFGDTVTDAVLSTTALNVAIAQIGVLGVNYAITQGLEWNENYSKEATAVLVGNNIISQYELLNNAGRDNIATILYNTLLDPLYYSSTGMPLTSALVNTWAPYFVNYTDSITLSTSVISGNKVIPYSVLSLLTQSQISTINTWTATNSYISANYYYLCPLNTSLYDSLLYVTSTGKAYFYNSATGLYSASTTTDSGYRYQIGNAVWTYAAGYTIRFDNVVYASLMDIYDWYAGRVFVTDVLGNSVVDGTTTLDKDDVYVPTLPAPVTAPDDTITLPNEIVPTLDITLTEPIVVEGDSWLNIFHWLPIAPLQSVWHYVIALINSGNDYILALADMVNSLPTAIWYPFLGGFVLTLCGSVIKKLLG